MKKTAPYPLLLEPILLEKVWGGRRLERLGKMLPPGKIIGESWEVADLAATSASGAGGAAARSVIANGPLRGRTLHDAMARWGADLLGAAQPTPEGGFPLLVKFLDACQNLSVQVHPSPAYAAAHPEAGGAHLKTECWYVLDAAPGSVIYKGIKPGVARQSFAAHIADGSAVNDLVAVPAVAGDCHLLPSGTVHALGAGVLVAEVQTPSDTTFRVYDWGRSGRTLHVEEALQCIEFHPAPGATRAGTTADRTRLAATDFFDIWEYRLLDGAAVTLDTPKSTCVGVSLLTGRVRVDSATPLDLIAGDTAILPAARVRGARLVASGAARLLAFWPNPARR